jgi:hypothetical protein
MVQRRRGDIREWLGTTQFPKARESSEDTYRLAAPYDRLFDDVLTYAHGQVTDSSGTRNQQLIRWWSALSLLRALASSPATAAATLQTRSISAGDDDAANINQVNTAAVYELTDDESLESADSTLGALTEHADTPHEAPATSREQATLQALRDRAAAIADEPGADARERADAKLAVLTRTVRALLRDRFQPIVFCRFIDTAHYVANHLRERFPKATVAAVTGELPPEERAGRIRALAELAANGDKILVATDCLSEGVNLQQDFQAVVHYDLAWNPTRHEQREGRVDRFGQPKDVVRAVTIYGSDNVIDKIIMDVLLRKHNAIRRDLGVSVPIPANTGVVITALMDKAMRRHVRGVQETLPFDLPGEVVQLELDWQSSADEEKRSRSRFAQHTISKDEVQEEIDAYRAALGRPDDVRGFIATALREVGAAVTTTPDGLDAQIGTVAVGLRDMLGNRETLRFRNDMPVPRGVAVLQRTDPTVGAIARHVLDAALDPAIARPDRAARRCGIVVSDAVSTTTTVLLVRFRLHLTLPGRTGPRAQVAEEARVLAFTGTPANPTWLAMADVDRVLAAKPTGNTPADAAANIMSHVLGALGALEPHLNRVAADLADTLRDAHIRVRTAARGDRAGALSIRGLTVEPQLPADILGAYLYRPGSGG